MPAGNIAGHPSSHFSEGGAAVPEGVDGRRCQQSLVFSNGLRAVLAWMMKRQVSKSSGLDLLH